MKKILVAASMASVALVSCTKEKEPVVVDETTTENGFPVGEKQGFIKGTLVGTTPNDRIAINEEFNCTFMDETFGSENYFSTNDEGYYLEFSRNSVKNIFGSKDFQYVSFSFSYNNDSKSLELEHYSIGLYKDIEGKKVDINEYSFQDGIDVSEIIFDETTGNLKGGFTIDILNNNDEKQYTFNGSLDVTLDRVYSK